MIFWIRGISVATNEGFEGAQGEAGWIGHAAGGHAALEPIVHGDAAGVRNRVEALAHGAGDAGVEAECGADGGEFFR